MSDYPFLPPKVSRRSVMLAAASSASLLCFDGAFASQPINNAQRKFTVDLCPGRIGVKVGQEESIRLAAKYGFESVEPSWGALVQLDESGQKKIQQLLEDSGLVWGAGGLSVDFRKTEEKFTEDLGKLPKIARSMEQCGVTRIGTWLMPAHAELTYLQNFELHARRLRSCAEILADFGLKLGLEYVGPKTSWTSSRYAFIHTMAETKELLSAIDMPNVGLVLDSWHWYTAEEQLSDLESLQAADVIAVDLNDAPEGIEVTEQMDLKRELPMATGVIDVATFLKALVAMGYDGPIRAEPFNQPLNALDNEPAVQATSEALHAAFELVGG